ncbi:hypothetical protein [Denitromonas ohlonensis]|uniref:Uncharacterized protein n=2 Tax=Denitromonas TaxID=139331 RepID=A0A557R359_9RHOO|nr:hypothetical protein [Denitromonas ohlonensis]TVO59566.1 hypothetical protein FHP90_19995 [Denitromonas ohlonensis]TVO76390.1 hypothetical protein FHP89_10930 [Denitromonas ohlonensis]
MRLIGFIGILALLAIAIFGIVISIQAGDLKGIGLMLLMIGMLGLFANMLWRGAQISRSLDSSERLAEGWAGESVSPFFRDQIAKSIEGHVLIVGTAASITMAVATQTLPATSIFWSEKAARHTALFGFWPLLAFVFYVRICGPHFVTSWPKVMTMLAVVAFPFLITYA